MLGVPRGQAWFRRVALVLGGTLIVMVVWSVIQEGAVEGLRTDWTAFDNAASRLLAGEDIYRPWDGEVETLPYLYPPFALWLTLPLGLVGFTGSWLIAAGSALAAFLGGLALLRRVAHADLESVADETARKRRIAFTTGIFGACTTGTAFNSILIGQYSGLYVLAVGAALFLFVADRPKLAGLALALLILKPNIAVAVVVVLLWSRSWKVLAGFAIGTVGALASTIPLGLGLWSGFAANLRQIADLQAMGIVPTNKMITFSSMVQEITGTQDTSPLAIGSWLVFSAVVGVATLIVWSPKQLAASPQRAFAVWAIFVIVANPRMFFYDGTLVIFGVLGLWSLPHGVLSHRSRRLLPVVAVGLWVASWGAAITPLNLFVAPLGATLIVVVAFETWSKAQESVISTPESAAVAVLGASSGASEGHYGEPPAAAA